LRKIHLSFKSNYEIRAPKLRVVGTDGKLIGILEKDEALKKARELKLDLVEIAPKANPPVAKIVDYGKFIYQEEKKLKKQKARSSDLKEIRFSPFIGEADFETRVKRVKEFLRDKDKVKLTVVFKGRQLGSKSFGYGLLDKIVKDLEGTVHVDSEPKFFGRHLSMIVSPRTASAKIESKKENAESKDEKIDNQKV